MVDRLSDGCENVDEGEDAEDYNHDVWHHFVHTHPDHGNCFAEHLVAAHEHEEAHPEDYSRPAGQLIEPSVDLHLPILVADLSVTRRHLHNDD